MTKSLILISLILGWVISMAQEVKEIVKRADEKMRGRTSQASMLIRIVRPTWMREMEVKTWMAQNDFAMILVLSPAREKGIVFLKRKKEVWNWIPTLERSIKLPPSMMNQSWMGTDFTNDDLVKESSVVEDYEHRIIGDTIINNRICYQIEFTPKPLAAVVWGKLLVCVDKKDFIELYTEFYDEDGKIINIMRANKIQNMDGRMIPTHFEMIPTDKPKQKTEIIYKSLVFDREINLNFFSLENMKRVN